MLDTNVVVESKQYIIVTLGIEQYGIDIGYIDNIVKMQKITRVPKAQDYFLGVINLRGEIIPVMSLRKKFNYEPDEFKDTTRIIIIKPEEQQAEKIGIIVDTVREVLTLGDDCIEKVQHDQSQDKQKYVSGVGKNKDALISLFNIPNLIGEAVDKQ
ncbi:MAG: chemotaxis protein CheW [Parasporobacterium sp.]|nr:chemotaxis protein CheW [Parasporobacterium sp.]